MKNNEILESEKIRLQKFISEAGLLSRRACEKAIVEKRITINGKIAKLGDKVHPHFDKVKLDSKIVTSKSIQVYWMLHKPALVLCSKEPASEAEQGMQTIYELPKLKHIKFHYFTVGRLDFKTEGLILLTNDGDFAEKLTHPRYEVPKTYHALLPDQLSDEQMKIFGKPVYLKEGKPVKVYDFKKLTSESFGSSKGYWYALTVREGRNRIVRKVFERLGVPVLRLFRTKFGKLEIDVDLKPGHYRELTSLELKSLRIISKPTL